MAMCRKQLRDMGFAEISKDLFMKNKGNGIRIFRDYREGARTSYAYHHNKTMPINCFKELRSIEKIEEQMTVSIIA